MRSWAVGALLGASVAFVGMGCKSKPEGAKDAAVAPAPPPAETAVKDAAKDEDAAITDAGPRDGATSFVPFVGDAGPNGCKALFGPQEQPFRGTAYLAQEGARLSVVANDSGRPKGFGVVIPPANVVVPPTRVLSFEAMSYPPCEPAGKSVYCPSKGGVIRRIEGGNEREVGKGRTGTRIVAAPLGEGHSIVAYLNERNTTEGLMIQAFGVLDDGEPVRISDEGSGATQISFVPHGDKVVFLYLDARTAMTPVHAREISIGKDGKLALGNDAVLMVGGPAERGVVLAAGRTKDGPIGLIPLPHDVAGFGMISLKVESPPKDDVKGTVSLYPNGIDPAPLAATRADSDRMYVARVVPESGERGAPRALELGHTDLQGAFTSHGLVARGVGITDVAITLDTSKTVWVLYGDAGHTWLSRFACP